MNRCGIRRAPARLVFCRGAFREETDGSAALDLLTSGKDHLQTLFDVGAVEKQAVDEIHPVL